MNSCPALPEPICHPCPVPWVAPHWVWRWGHAAPGRADTWRAGHWRGRHVGHVYCAVLVTQSWSSEPPDKFSVSWGVIAEQRSRDIKVTCRVWSGHTCQPNPNLNHPHKPLNCKIFSVKKQNYIRHFIWSMSMPLFFYRLAPICKN